MLDKKFSTIILAAGKSKRMRSNIPKVLHRIGGKYILQHVIDIAVKIGSRSIYVVYGDYCTKNFLIKTLGVQKCFINWVLQSPALGTGHAVKQVLPFLFDDFDTLILYGDVPLISVATLHKLFNSKCQNSISLLTVFLEKSDGYARIIRRKEGNVIGIVEDSDLKDDQRSISEVNSGIMIVTNKDLKRWVNSIKNFNVNSEFYLTEIVHMAWSERYDIHTVFPAENDEVQGVNDKLQLSKLERIYQRKQAKHLLLSGVTLSDIDRFDIRGKLYHGDDVYIDINVIIEGIVILGNRVSVGMGCILKDCIIEDDVMIHPYSFIDGSKISSRSIVGPFARLRFGCELGEESFVGNFVELKSTQLGKKSKVGHISYIGDTDIGHSVNVGAGVVVCNYDGFDKYKTVIGNNVFIGADSQLIAPLKIGSGAKIGAGTTVTRNVMSDDMVISRIRQFSITSWRHLVKKKENNDKK